ncbi:MAG: carbohydrate kinase [Thermoleophilia bacterium]|nr:carbohydrate kinase [Thermoleophilia bacterium]
MGVLAVIGHTTRDLVGGGPSRPGGVPFHVARALGPLGEPALVVTRCAAEDAALLDRVRAEGVPVVWRAEAVTPVFRHVYVDGRRDTTIDALGEPWTADDARGWVGEALHAADWVHAGALWRGDFPAETLAVLRRGRRLSLDGQGLVRLSRVGPVELDGDFDPEILRSVDVLHLAEEEAAALGLTLDEGSLRTLGVPEVVVTLGERGAIVWAGGVAKSVPADPVSGADPTGAGDAFTAAYVASRRHGHAPAAAAGNAARVVHDLLAGGHAA